MPENKLSLFVLSIDAELIGTVKELENRFHLFLFNDFKSFRREFTVRRVDMVLIDLEPDIEEALSALKLVKETPAVIRISNSGSIDTLGKLPYLNPIGIISDAVGNDLLKTFLLNAKKRLSKDLDEERKFTDQEILIKRMNLVQEISRDITSQKPLNELLTSIMEGLKLAVDSDASSILLLDESSNKLQFYITMGDKGDLIKGHNLEPGEGIGGWVAENRKSIIIDDCYKDARFNPEFDKLSEYRTKSMLCVPMIFKDKLVGVIQALNKADAETFDGIDMNIAEVFAAQSAVSIENARLLEIQVENSLLQKEIETAREIQNQLLPETIPEFEDLEISAELIPARQVGGDYYNIFRLNERKTLIIICDVTGKSIPAALIVSSLHSALLSLIQSEHEPSDLKYLAENLNKVLLNSTTQDKFVTAWLGIYDHVEKKITSINAGHNNPFLFSRKSGKIELGRGGLMLGIFPTEYEFEIHDFEEEDLLVCFTDGVTEAMNESEEEFGEMRLTETIERSASLKVDDIMNGILAEIKEFTKGTPQSDDITCVIIKVKK